MAFNFFSFINSIVYLYVILLYFIIPSYLQFIQILYRYNCSCSVNKYKTREKTTNVIYFCCSIQSVILFGYIIKFLIFSEYQNNIWKTFEKQYFWNISARKLSHFPLPFLPHPSPVFTFYYITDFCTFLFCLIPSPFPPHPLLSLLPHN